MVKKNFTIVSEFDGLQLKGVLIEPEKTPKGIFQIVHGMCEHKLYYEPMMEFFAEHGYVAACCDHRGHGESVKTDADLGWFGDGSGKAVVEDCAQVTKYLKGEYPELPVILFGHSMGSMVARCYLREHDELIDKLIVCGSPSYNPMTPPAFLLRKLIALVKGERHRSKLLNDLSMGNGAAKLETTQGGSWLTRDGAIVEKKHSDPWCSYVFTCNGFENLLNLMKYTYRKKGYQVKNPNLPIHFVAGSDDIMIVNDMKWYDAIEFLEKVGYKEITGKLYKGMRHELHNEFGKEEYFLDLLRFVKGTIIS